MKSIFVQIASYRDPELVPTIDDLLKKAKNPERLKICIAHQFSKDDQWDRLDKYADDSRFIVIEIPHNESEGVCWARNQIQQHYEGEDYTLHLDSHHRFIQDWDTECVDMLNGLIDKGINKPLITSYVPSYDPTNYPKNIDNNVYGIYIDKWLEGTATFRPYMLPTRETPTLSRFYSGHFAFTLGQFAEEVKHDPLMYFEGEGITMSARAYTHGYDLFTPSKTLVWHNYSRESLPKHWDDHSNWRNKDSQSKSRVRQLLGVNGEVCAPCNKNTFKDYGLGDVRTLKDYEVYAGINFINQSVTVRCQQNISPPGTEEDSIHETKKNYSFKINKNDFIYNDYVFAIIIIEDSNGEVVHNDMIVKDEIQALKEHSKSFIQVNRQLIIDNPLRYLIWPYSQRKGWGDKLISYF